MAGPSALFRDSCLYIVPGSHSVPRTPEQRKHSETLEPPSDPLAMPGCMQVILQRKSLLDARVQTQLMSDTAGETVFYNSNILHCATYDSSERRATLHGTMGDVKGGSSRARNILQHGLGWMKDDRFREGLDEKGRKMLDRLLVLHESAPKVGYSLAA